MLRNILDILNVSPVMTASAVISLGCASLVFVQITSSDETMPVDGSTLQSDVSVTNSDNVTKVTDFNQVALHKKASNSPVAMESNRAEPIRVKPEHYNSAYQTPTQKNKQIVKRELKKNNHIKADFNATNDDVEYNESDQYETELDSQEIQELINNNPFFSALFQNTESLDEDDSGDDVSGNVSSVNTNESDNTASEEVFVESTKRVYPTYLENTVQMDFDETQTISCIPIATDGPPCMCTHTTTDLEGSFTELVDNCS